MLQNAPDADGEMPVQSRLFGTSRLGLVHLRTRIRAETYRNTTSWTAHSAMTSRLPRALSRYCERAEYTQGLQRRAERELRRRAPLSPKRISARHLHAGNQTLLSVY